jgi:hypothetical protein
VEASPVDGPGFRMEKAGPKAASQVFIFATGSGITPIKALIESGALQVSGAIEIDFPSTSAGLGTLIPLSPPSNPSPYRLVSEP